MKKQKPQERTAQEVVATQEDITKAVESLTDADLLRIRKFAQLRLKAVGEKTRGHTFEDLLGDAILGTMEGERKWFKERVPFLSHLFGVIRSLSTHLAEKYDRKEGAVGWMNLTIDSEGKEIDPLSLASSEIPNPERNFEAKEQIEKLKEALCDDALALEVLNGLLEEMKGPEIQEILSLSKMEYETIRRRISRTAKKVLI